MRERFGIILLDSTELILRIYETDHEQWKLVHYLSRNCMKGAIKGEINLDEVTKSIADIFSSPQAQHIAEWKVCARSVPILFSQEFTKLTGLAVEHLTNSREQEVLCKGMFTELW